MDELLAQEKALVEQLSNVRAEIKEKKLARAEADSGVRAGCIVCYRGVEHRVIEVDTHWRERDKPWVTGTPKRKDGTFGTAVRNLYAEWELVAPSVAK